MVWPYASACADARSEKGGRRGWTASERSEKGGRRGWTASERASNEQIRLCMYTLEDTVQCVIQCHPVFPSGLPPQC